MSKQKPTLPVRTPTEREYQTTQKYIEQWQESVYVCFATFLLSQNMAQATRIKHNGFEKWKSSAVTPYTAERASGHRRG